MKLIHKRITRLEHQLGCGSEPSAQDLMQWTKYFTLPEEITPFERRFLAHLNKVALVFFYLHIPILSAG